LGRIKVAWRSCNAVSLAASAHSILDAYARAHEPPRSGSRQRIFAGAHLSRVGRTPAAEEVSRSVMVSPIPRRRRHMGKAVSRSTLGRAVRLSCSWNSKNISEEKRNRLKAGPSRLSDSSVELRGYIDLI
jgi:hypothetical protein